jgi:hypothetical protein
MGEREKGKELIGRGELFFLSHPGKEKIFSGYGLTVEEGNKGKLVGLLMVDRPRLVDQEWLMKVERNFGEFRLVPITVTGERGIVCRMEIEAKSITHLCRLSSDKSKALKKALEPLIEMPPKPTFIMSWNVGKHLWESRLQSMHSRSSNN